MTTRRTEITCKISLVAAIALLQACSEPAGTAKTPTQPKDDTQQMISVLELPFKMAQGVIEKCEAAAPKQRAVLDEKLQSLAKRRSQLDDVQIKLELAQIKWMPSGCSGLDKKMQTHYSSVVADFESALLRQK